MGRPARVHHRAVALPTVAANVTDVTDDERPDLVRATRYPA